MILSLFWPSITACGCPSRQSGWRRPGRSSQRSGRGELETLSHPDLDGAWLFRFESGTQLLLVRRGAQLMEYQYDGELDLSGKLSVFAAALERYGEGGAS